MRILRPDQLQSLVALSGLHPRIQLQHDGTTGGFGSDIPELRKLALQKICRLRRKVLLQIQRGEHQQRFVSLEGLVFLLGPVFAESMLSLHQIALRHQAHPAPETEFVAEPKFNLWIS